MQKILIIHPYLTQRGGAERKMLLIAKELVSRGYQVTILLKKYDKKNTFFEFIDDRVNIISLNSKNKSFWIIDVLWYLISHKFDLIIAHNNPANIPVGLYKLLFAKQKTAWICNEVAVLLDRKKSLIWNVYYFFEKHLNRLFSTVIANSNFTCNEILNYYGINAKVIHSGVEIKSDINLDNIRQDIKNWTKKPYILSISRIEKHKNIEFLDAIASGIDINLLVAGNGSDVEYIKSLEKKHTNLIYLGSVNEDEKFFLYKNSKIFTFLPTHEPLGVTIMEAMSQNAVVISFNNGGPREIIISGKNGFLVDDASSYLRCIDTVLKNNTKFSDASKYIRNNFSNFIMTQNFANTFENIIKEPV